MGANLSSAIADSKEQRDEKDIIFKGFKISTEDRANHGDELFKQLPGLTHIEINDCRLKQLGTEVALWRATLEVLRLPNNLLEKLPAETSRLSALTELDLSYNQFVRLPLNELATLQHLTHLDLKHNRLSILPPISGKAASSSEGIAGSLASLAHLTHLDLSHNQFAEIPMGLCDIPSLKSLDISSNQLKSIPPDFARWMGQKLTSLVVSTNNISSLPDEIGALKSLITLDLSENDLHELPSRIGSLLHLQNLDLQHNHLKALPITLGQMVSLVSLKLHDNELEDLPSEIAQLTSLSELFLQENKLRRLNPAIGRCVSLRKLYAEYNEITELPADLAELKRLIVLILHHNKLEEVPLVLASLTGLLRLSLDDNPIKDPSVKQIIASEGSLALFKRVNASEMPLASMRTIRGLRREAADDSRIRTSSMSSGDTSSSDSPAPSPNSKFLNRTISFSTARKFSDSEPNVSSFSHSSTGLRGRASTLSDPPPGLTGSAPGGIISSAILSSSSAGYAEKAPEFAKFKSAFNSLLEEQDFSAKKKEMLKKMSTNDKWNLLTQYKGSTLELLRGKEKTPATKDRLKTGGSSIGPRNTRSPQDYCALIKQKRATRTELQTLKKLLSIQSQTWILQFIDAGGIASCVVYLNYLPSKFVKSGTDAGCIAELLGILRFFSEICLKQLLTTNQAVMSVVLNLFLSTSDEQSSLCLELLDVFCCLYDIGPGLTAEALEKVFKQRSPTAPLRQKYLKLIQLITSTSMDLDHRFSAFTILAAVVDSFDDLTERFDARLQLVSEGLNAQLKSLQSEPGLSTVNKMLVERYEEEYAADYAEMIETFDKDTVVGRFIAAGINPGADVGDDLASVELSVAGYYSKRLLVKNVPGTKVQDMMVEIGSIINISGPNLDDYGLFSESVRLEPSKLISECGTAALLSLEFRPRVWRLYIDISPDLKKDVPKKDRRFKFDPSLSVAEIVHLVTKKLAIDGDRHLALYHHMDGGTQAKEASEGSVSDSSASASIGPSSSVDREPAADSGLWLDDIRPLFTFGPNLFKRKGARSYRFQLKIARLPLNIRIKDGQTQKMLLDPTLQVAHILKQLTDKFLPAGSPTSLYGLFGEESGPTSSSSDTSDTGAWLDPKMPLGHYQYTTLKFTIKPQPVEVQMPGEGPPKSHTIDFSSHVSQIIQQICAVEGLDGTTVSLFHVSILSARSPSTGPQMMLNPSLDLSRQVDIGAPMMLILKPTSENGHDADPSILVNIWDEKAEKDVNVTYNTAKPDEIETGTLNILIAHLTSIKEVDEEFRRIFLLTYQFFTKPMVLLQKLLERFSVPRDQYPSDEVYKSCRELVQLRVLIFFKFWMQTHLKPETLQQIRSRLTDWDADGQEALKKQFLNLVNPHRHTDQGSRATLAFPKSRIPKGITDHTQLSFHMLDDHEVSRQMTLNLFSHYSKIKPTDLTLGAWAKPSTYHLCANLMSVINDFNHVAGWVGTSLLRESKVRLRAKLYAKFVDMAAILLEFKNYHLLTAILSGLNSASISRLKFTIARLPKNTIPTLNRLEEIMSMQSSFKNYRALLADSFPPAIPYLGVYLTDLTFINDGNPDMLSNNRINFVKHRYVHNIIETIQKFQKDEFPFHPVPIIQKFLLALEVLPEQGQYELSLQLEPRGAEKSDIK